MKMSYLLLALATSASFASTAGAQSRGEADPAQSRAAPTERVAPAQKQAARAARKQEGAQVARTHPIGEDQPSTVSKAPRAPKEVRQAAKDKRRADVLGAKKGEITSGEK